MADQPAMIPRKLARGAPSPTQVDVLARMRAEGGRLVRMSGGRWTTPTHRDFAVRNGLQSPAWRVNTRTVRAMEERKLLVADGRDYIEPPKEA